MKLYELDYSKPSGTIPLDKYELPLPVRPALKDMENYGLPIKEQKFKRVEIPKSLRQPKPHLSTEEQQFIDDEWHKRKNGVWTIIKGLPIYLTGPYYTYLNYWWTKNGVQPEFRYIQCLIFLFWDMVVRNKDCYGAKLVKPRRIGGTEFTLFLMWEYVTRVRNVKGGMQSKNEATVQINFKRLTRGNKRVVWFMRPVQKGSDDPEGSLEYRYPVAANTTKSLREQAENGAVNETVYSEPEMNSEIDYRACDPLAYDNEELNRYILNESGKLERMSLLSCWDKVKPCLHYFDGAEIVGKAWFESTIEEINDDQIEEIGTLCRDSDATKLDDNGRTISGLWLLFINYLDAAKPDEWGFGDKEQAKIFHDNKIEALKKKKKFKEITSLLRKEPEKLSDALSPSGQQSSFNKDRLQDNAKRLKFPESYGFEEKEWTVRGDFIWAGGKPDTRVIFIEDTDNGKFVVSQLLKNGQDCASVEVGGVKFPTMAHKYRGGVDPYEHDQVVDEARASKGAGVIMRMYDDNEDGAKYDENGNPSDYGWEWKSKQPVCHYLAREDDPDLFFEDMLMMHYYYGCQMNVENNKQSIKKYFRKRGYGEYLMARPESTMDPTSRTVNVAQVGTPATTDTIDQYFMAIAHYVMVYGNANKHIEITNDLLELNKANRTKHDLGVAFGWALIACEKEYQKVPTSGDEGTGEEWFDFHNI